MILRIKANVLSAGLGRGIIFIMAIPFVYVSAIALEPPRPVVVQAKSAPHLDDQRKSVHISGRVIYPVGDGKSGFNVRIARIEPRGAVALPPVHTDTNGVFTLLGDQGSTYRISLGPGVKTPAKTVRVTNEQDIDVGDMILEKCTDIRGAYAKPPDSAPKLVGKLRLEQIVIEPQHMSGGFVGLSSWTGLASPVFPSANGEGSNASVEFPQCWSGPTLARREEWEGLCEVSFNQFFSMEDFVGGKIKTIRVISHDPRLTSDQIKEEVRKVWLGIFHYATCQIEWAEGSMWNIRATVEYEDGKKSTILTDGLHVQVQDREGKYWYMREWPAVV
jgi:hypothetical protein